LTLVVINTLLYLVILPLLSMLQARLSIVTNSPDPQLPAVKSAAKDEVISRKIVRMESTEFLYTEKYA